MDGVGFAGRVRSAVLVCKCPPMPNGVEFCVDVCHQEGVGGNAGLWSPALGGISCFNVPPSGSVKSINII